LWRKKMTNFLFKKTKGPANLDHMETPLENNLTSKCGTQTPQPGSNADNVCKNKEDEGEA
jgi:hypothetical protein